MSRFFVPAIVLVALASAPVAHRADDDVSAGPKLKFYGFADFNYRYAFQGKKDSAWRANTPKFGGATIGNLNLYMDAQIAQRVRSLVEIRFTYAPNGSLTVPAADGGTYKGNTSVTDYSASYTSTFNWGGIDIERAWIEYKFSDLVGVKVGEFLTPYGVWNEDHGSPTLIGTKPPYVIGGEWFPRHQVGAYVYGTHYFGDTRLGYALTLSNGRIGTNSDAVKANAQPGFGGRVFAEGESLGSWKVGLSGYQGRYTERRSTTAAGTTTTAVTSDYKERIFAADVTWKIQHLTLVMEGMYGNVDYTESVTTEDLHRAGGYALVAYELPYQIIPWVQYDRSRASNHSAAALEAFKLGMNKVIVPGVVAKVAWNHVWYSHQPTNKDKFDEITSQVAWAF